MVTTNVVSVTSTSTPVVVFEAQPANASQMCVRNTGTVTVLLGTAASQVFPLASNEFLGLQVAPDDEVYAVLQSGSTAGQLTVLGVG